MLTLSLNATQFPTNLPVTPPFSVHAWMEDRTGFFFTSPAVRRYWRRCLAPVSPYGRNPLYDRILVRECGAPRYRLAADHKRDIVAVEFTSTMVCARTVALAAERALDSVGPDKPLPTPAAAHEFLWRTMELVDAARFTLRDRSLTSLSRTLFGRSELCFFAAMNVEYGLLSCSHWKAPASIDSLDMTQIGAPS